MEAIAGLEIGWFMYSAYLQQETDSSPRQRRMPGIMLDRHIAHLLEQIHPDYHLARHVAHVVLSPVQVEAPAFIVAQFFLARGRMAQLLKQIRQRMRRGPLRRPCSRRGGV